MKTIAIAALIGTAACAQALAQEPELPRLLPQNVCPVPDGPDVKWVRAQAQGGPSQSAAFHDEKYTSIRCAYSHKGSTIVFTVGTGSIQLVGPWEQGRDGVTCDGSTEPFRSGDNSSCRWMNSSQ
jgi:hypothetical protein